MVFGFQVALERATYRPPSSPRRRGSSTPRFIDLITTASGILDPRLRGEDDCYGGSGLSGLRLVAEIRFDRAVHLDGQGIAVTVLGIACGHAHPAFADAVFLDIGFLDALE